MYICYMRYLCLYVSLQEENQKVGKLIDNHSSNFLLSNVHIHTYIPIIILTHTECE